MPIMSLTPGQATAVAGVATLNQDSGIITTDSLSTGSGGTYALAINCDQVTINSDVQATLVFGTNTQGIPTIVSAKPGNNVINVTIANAHGTLALNGTLKVMFVVFN